MSVEENKRVARVFHDGNAEDVEEILAPDFKGENPMPGFSWNREQHKEHLIKHPRTDVVHELFGEGDRVCTFCTRNDTVEGKRIERDIATIFRFKDGKITHHRAIFDMKQFEEQIANKQ